MNSPGKIQISTQIISNKPLCSSSRCTYYIFISTALLLKELMSLTLDLHSSLLTVSTFISMHATCMHCFAFPFQSSCSSTLSPSCLSQSCSFLLFLRIHFGHCIHIFCQTFYIPKVFVFNLF